MILEDILDEIVSNGGKITSVTVEDTFGEIIYVDSNGNQVKKRYEIDIDDDGGESWVEITTN